VTGEWSGETPVCEIVQCQPPGDILNGVVEGDVFTYGARVTYRCHEGTTFILIVTITMIFVLFLQVIYWSK
jgi:hypothetical protein